MRDTSGENLFADLAEVIGPEATGKLLDAFCGDQIYVPREPDPLHPLCQAIGQERAGVLAEYWHGMVLKFPVTPVRRWRVASMHAAGASVSQISRTLLVSRSWVYQVLSEPHQRVMKGPKELRQPVPRSPA